MEIAEAKNSELITTEECQKYLGKFKLDDEKVVTIKDNLVGIVDSIINSYLEKFR